MSYSSRGQIAQMLEQKICTLGPGFKPLLGYLIIPKRRMYPIVQSWLSELWFVTGMNNRLKKYDFESLKCELNCQDRVLTLLTGCQSTRWRETIRRLNYVKFVSFVMP